MHPAARVVALAGPSEVLVSAGTKALVDDTTLVFESRGTHELKGLAAPLEAFAVIPG